MRKIVYVVVLAAFGYIQSALAYKTMNLRFIEKMNI